MYCSAERRPKFVHGGSSLRSRRLNDHLGQRRPSAGPQLSPWRRARVTIVTRARVRFFVDATPRLRTRPTFSRLSFAAAMNSERKRPASAPAWPPAEPLRLRAQDVQCLLRPVSAPANLARARRALAPCLLSTQNARLGGVWRKDWEGSDDLVRCSELPKRRRNHADHAPRTPWLSR